MNHPVLSMASITLKSIPMELHAQLKIEAAVNFRFSVWPVRMSAVVYDFSISDFQRFSVSNHS
jgi:hypothetical protein